jgi:hypothetical protein
LLIKMERVLMGQHKSWALFALVFLVVVNLGCGLSQGLDVFKAKPTPLPETPAAEQVAVQPPADVAAPESSAQPEGQAEDSAPAQPTPIAPQPAENWPKTNSLFCPALSRHHGPPTQR